MWPLGSYLGQKTCLFGPSLVSFVGFKRVLGAPFRVTDEVFRSGEADSEWLSAGVGELSQKAMCLCAHLGLESAGTLSRELLDDP